MWSIASAAIIEAAKEDNTAPTTREQLIQQRMSYYFQFQDISLPWYYLAAIDQFERNIQEVRNDIPKRESAIAIQFSDEYWAGTLNPIQTDTSPLSIDYFNGMGKDGNADGIADKSDDEDVLFSMTKDYADWMKQRRELFREKTGTNKTIHLTLITPNGLVHGKHSPTVQSTVNMDDLFL